MLRYRLSVPEPENHIAELELAVDDVTDGELTVRMAAWCPGSYLVRDYARFVRQLAAHDHDGNALPVRKTSKQSWTIDAADTKRVVVTYRVYGYDLSVRTNHIDDTHAFLHGPATFLYIEERRDEACTVEVTLPAGRDWSIATGMRESDGVYHASDLDQLLDSPLHLGVTERRQFEVAGVPFELAVWGHVAPAERDLDTLVTDLAPILEGHAARFGGLPFDDYTFILMLAPKAYGGLEHKNSSANLSSSYAFVKENTYLELLELLSHEFFHVWNGKRIMPASFIPFDYQRENYTRCLWVMEGLTSFYDRYTVLRSGPMGARRYFEKLAEEWGRLQSTPGRHVHSIEEASFDAWIKLYKPDASNLNTTVSYYLKGGLVAATLDLWIRRHSGGDKSLEDVLTALWERYGAQGVGHPENVEGLFAEATGLDVREPFDRWIRGTEDPPLATELAHLGVTLLGKGEDNGPSTYLGARFSERPLRLAGVMDDSPMARAGVSPGDEVVAIDGYRVTSQSDVRRLLASREPGEVLEVSHFRRQRLLSTRVELAAAPPRKVQISTTTTPSDDEKARYTAWLGEEWPSSPLSVTSTAKRWT